MPSVAIRHLLLALLVLSAPCAAREWHVSADGTREHRTIQSAIGLAQPGDVVLVHAGVYRETVVFPRSGTAEAPIVLRAAEGESPTVSGCEPIEGWTLEDPALGLWSAPMPWTLGAGRNQAFGPGGVLLEARFPNEPAPGLGMYVSDLSPLWPTFGEFHIPKETGAEQPGRITSPLLEGQPEGWWTGGLYYGVHYEGWCGQTGVIESSGPGEITVGDRTTGWWFTGMYTEDEGRGMIVGHRHALDQPGEWLWEDDALHLVSPPGQAPSGIEAKARQLALDLSGREYIRVEGMAVRAASVRMDGSAWCTFDRCDLSYISHFLRQYSMGQVEHGRDTVKSGETGIYISGHDNAFLNSSVRISAGAGFHLRGWRHTIHNCLIDEVDYTSHYLNAITDAVADFGEYEDTLYGGHTITYNTMRNAGRHFWNIHGNGTSLSSRDRGPMDYCATLFAHNHLYNGMLQTRDAGLITGYYGSGGTVAGIDTEIAYNVIHDTYDIFGMRIDALGLIYLDAGTCNVSLHHNLLWAAPGSHQRGLWYNTMCVGIRESANVFHREFDRTCEQLEPADFPEGVPFRFGHDFTDPPAVPSWPPLRSLELPVAATGLADGSVVPLGEVDLGEGEVTAVALVAGTAPSINADHAGRLAPRHRRATDPLVLEATANDGASEGIATQWTFIHGVRDGAWLRFAEVPLGAGYERFRAVYGCDREGERQLEVRLDSPEGPILGSVALARTDRMRDGHVQIYAHAVGSLEGSDLGTRDVYVVFRNADGEIAGPVGEFEYFRFERYRGNIALASDEVRLELRADSPSGPRIAELWPRASGGRPLEIAGSMEPLAGRHALYAVVRGALSGPVVDLAGLRVLSRDASGSREGIGVAPLTRDDRLVLPEATHLPRSRPNDRYPHAASTARPRARLGDQLAQLASEPFPTEGLALWLDASDTTTVERDADGRVSIWRDRSGNDRHAAQEALSFRPEWAPEGLEGKPAVRFTEERLTRLLVPDLADEPITATVLAVFSNPEPGAEVNHDARILTASDGSGLDYLIGIAASVPGTQTGGPRLGAWVFPDRWAREVRIGCFSPLYQTYFTGCISEIVVWDRPLTSLEMDRAMARLVLKWDLPD